ncbi:MAG TPA: helix-turn-helix transcriptional regulator [Longimicrobium sp.]|nr:helix-turn-helix transcriptional regulator [Longimicrobium sp.]
MNPADTSFEAVFAAIRLEVPGVAEVEKKLGSRLTIARNVLSLRVRAGWTQSELARRAGMSQPRITRIEAAQIDFGIGTLDRLASALGVDVAGLFTVQKPLAAAARPRHSDIVNQDEQ